MSPTDLPRGYRHRPMDAADVPAVHALETRLFPTDSWPEEMFRAELAHPTRAYTVVTGPEGTVVAYAGMMAVDRTGDVQTIAVVPEHEGRGIGRWLMHRMHGQARRRGARTMMLEVRADNPRARGLYASLGYEDLHVRRRYYRDGADAIVMAAPLDRPDGPPDRGTRDAQDAPRAHAGPHGSIDSHDAGDIS